MKATSWILGSCIVLWATVASAVDVLQSSTPGLPILDFQTTTDTISVVDSLTIEDVRIGVDVTHTFQADLFVELTSPNSTSVTLTQNAGAGANDILVTFASGGLPFEASQLTAGLTFWMQALGPGAMADFHGGDSAGTWSLSIYDDAAGDSGTLNEWSVFLSDNPPPPPPPINDVCAQATVVAESSVTAFQTQAASVSGIVNACSGPTAPTDVWYRVDVTCDADVTLATCGSAFDTTLAVWDGTGGCPLPGDSPIDCADNTCATDAEVTVFAVGGQTLYVQVGGFSGATGDGTLTVSTNAAPTNDACSDAFPVFGGTTAFSTLCATVDGVAPGCGGFSDPIDIWYLYTADCDGMLMIDTFGSGFDTRLAIWPGTTCPAAGTPPLYCNDDTFGLQSQIIVPAVFIGDTFVIQVGGYSSASGTGVLNLACDLAPAPVITGLGCTPGLGSIDLSWTSPISYDEILVYLDGVLEATLPGTATLASITGLTDFTTYDVCVEGVLSGFLPTQECCAVTTPGDSTGQHVIFAGETVGGLIDSVAALDAALAASGIAAVIVDDLATVGGAPAALWLALGTFPSNHSLTTVEGNLLVDLQSAGTPIYLSGGDTFGFDGPTAFADVDGVAPGALDGDDSHLGMTGADFLAGFDASYTQDQAGTDWTDRLQPASAGEDALGSDARVILTDDGTGSAAATYNTGIAYYTNSGGRICCVSTEFGGYDGDANAFAAAFVAFLLGGPPPGGGFRRGDTNGDGGFDISDAVSTLAALFIIGTPAPDCVDAADSNDDGGLDISDAVFSLAALFIGGSPPPPAPGVAACGVDPTLDGLDCVSYGCL